MASPETDPTALHQKYSRGSELVIKFDPESMALLERLATAIEALLRKQGIAPLQEGPTIGPFLGDPNTIYRREPLSEAPELEPSDEEQ